MEHLREDLSRVVILGGGKGGEAMLELLCDGSLIKVVAMVDHNSDTLGMIQAKSAGIPVYADVTEALATHAPCVALNLTNDAAVEDIACRILGSGAVIRGLESRLLWHMVTNLMDAKKDLEYQATHDSLTGLYNRRFVMDQLHRVLSQAIRYGFECSLVLIDLDYFKRVNDCYGHVAGDFVLKQVSRMLQHNVRSADVLGRWGGEEFIVLLPHTNVVDARLATQKWLKRVQEESVVLANGEALEVSFSAGVTGLVATDKLSIDQHIETLLERVDRCLYAAKDCGRACVVGDMDEA